MRNPLRSEAEAYRFLLGTVVYFGAIVLASVVGGRWWGFGVFAALSVVALAWFFQRGPVAPVARSAPVHRGGDEE